jgi:hypothetical protein
LFFRFKTGVEEVTGAVEDRRAKAKELLLEVEEQFGKEKLAEVVYIIKHFHQKSIVELKTMLFTLFTGKAEFQQRFLEFLPKRFHP